MKYIGLDIHKDFCVATEVDKEGNVIREGRIETNERALRDYFSSIDKGKVALESTGIWEYVYDILDALGFDVILVNPVKTRAIAEAKIKTDKVDSKILAHLLRSNLLPEVYVGTTHMRNIKKVVKERLFLKKLSTQIKNRIHAELLRRGIKQDMNIFTTKGRKYLRSLHITSIERELTVLKSVDTEIAASDKELREYYKTNEDAQLLTSIPGIGYYTAVSLIAVIGDIRRFSSSEKLSSYFGLVPSTHQSATTLYHGSITKEGPSHIRFLLVQSAWSHIRVCDTSCLTRFYHRLAKRKGPRKAIIATARKMTRVIYWMLTNKESFYGGGYEPRKYSAE